MLLSFPQNQFPARYIIFFLIDKHFPKVYNEFAIKFGEVVVGLRVNSYRLDPLNLSGNAVVGIIFVSRAASIFKYDAVFCCREDIVMKKNIALPTLFGCSILLIWECCVHLFQISLYILPAPSKISMAIFENFEPLLMHSLVTLQEALIGLAIAIIAAVLIAIGMDISKLFKNSIFPHLIVTQTVPVMVLGPLFTIWLGFGAAPKILMVILMCFFPMVISLSDALSSVDQAQINLLKSFGATRWQIYTFVKIPAAAPSLFSGMKVAATYCISGAIVGEWLSSSAGLGYYMLRVKNGYMLDKVFACVVVIILLSLGLNLMVSLIEKLCLPQKKKKERRGRLNEKNH